MKKNLVIIILIFGSILFAQLNLDPYYHTNEEIQSELEALAAEYPDIMKLEQIGTTFGSPFQDPLPVWAVKISDNVNVNEDEPALLYVGSVHAEEVLGVEITMDMIHEILENRQMSPYNVYIAELENWFVPTYNPEGLGVVMETEHVSWRKNMRDNNNNGVWDVEPGEGGDIDGVDMNRNYSFNWVHGDTLYCSDGDQPFDYYRGPAPISEGGIQAIVNLAAQEHFIYSIAWHSSRTGNLSEKVFYSSEWDDYKYSPDFEHNENIGEHVAALIQKQSLSASYEPSPSRGRKGSAHEWFYKEHGTTQLLIECGTSNLQPNAEIAQGTVDRCKPGAYWLMHRALGYQVDAAMLTGHVTDAVTGEPIVAEIIIEENHASFFTPRLTDATYGRYWKQLNDGSYTLRIRKEGYEDHVESVIVNNSGWTIREVALQPKAAITISGTVNGGGNALNGEIEILGEYPQIIPFTNGSYQIDTYAGMQEFIVKVDGFVPAQYNNEVTVETGLNFEMDSLIVLMEENFEAGLDSWTTQGSWATEIDPVSNTFSAVVHQNFFAAYADFYPNNMDASITYNNLISLRGVDEDVVLSFNHKYRTEHEVDYARVEVSTNGSDWNTLAEYAGINTAWEDVMNPANDNVVLSLADYVGNYIYLRFHFTSDDTQRDPGWWVDNVQIISSVGAEAPNDEIPGVTTKLIGNYPNPFNPTTNIRFNLANGNSDKVNLKIYNVKGQIVKTFKLNSENLSASNNIVWNGRDDNNRSVSSGVYFYKLSAGDYTNSKKMILLK